LVREGGFAASAERLRTPDIRRGDLLMESFSDKLALFDSLANGYREAQVLLTANRIGLFAAIGSDALSARELAAALKADPRGVRILCDALTSLGLLNKAEDRYSNSESALEFMLPGSPNARTALALHGARLYERWGRLYDVVKSGCPVAEESTDPRLGGGEGDFAKAMAESAGPMARKTVESLDLDGVRSLLDVGGGPATFAIEFARCRPNLHVVLLDSEGTLAVAREKVEQAGLTGRIKLLPGDVFETEPGELFDFIFASNLVHSYSFEENARLVLRCARWLASGGRLCLKDFFLDPDRTSPRFSALFAVNMLVNTPQGDCYTLAEAAEWLRQAQLQQEATIELPPMSRLVIGRKG
jgi:SAM-dependent methyltransferase